MSKVKWRLAGLSRVKWGLVELPKVKCWFARLSSVNWRLVRLSNVKWMLGKLCKVKCKRRDRQQWSEDHLAELTTPMRGATLILNLPDNLSYRLHELLDPNCSLHQSKVHNADPKYAQKWSDTASLGPIRDASLPNISRILHRRNRPKSMRFSLDWCVWRPPKGVPSRLECCRETSIIFAKKVWIFRK